MVSCRQRGASAVRVAERQVGLGGVLGSAMRSRYDSRAVPRLRLGAREPPRWARRGTGRGANYGRSQATGGNGSDADVHR